MSIREIFGHINEIPRYIVMVIKGIFKGILFPFQYIKNTYYRLIEFFEPVSGDYTFTGIFGAIIYFLLLLILFFLPFLIGGLVLKMLLP